MYRKAHNDVPSNMLFNHFAFCKMRVFYVRVMLLRVLLISVCPHSYGLPNTICNDITALSICIAFSRCINVQYCVQQVPISECRRMSYNKEEHTYR